MDDLTHSAKDLLDKISDPYGPITMLFHTGALNASLRKLISLLYFSTGKQELSAKEMWTATDAASVVRALDLEPHTHAEDIALLREKFISNAYDNRLIELFWETLSLAHEQAEAVEQSVMQQLAFGSIKPEMELLLTSVLERFNSFNDSAEKWLEKKPKLRESEAPTFHAAGEADKLGGKRRRKSKTSKKSKKSKKSKTSRKSRRTKKRRS